MKVLIISHIADPDGVTPVILSKLVFDDVDYILLDASATNTEILKLIDNHEFDKYDLIYITDLGLNEEVSIIIDKDESLKAKLKVFDHHIGNVLSKDYSFATIVDIDEEGNKQSGTSLYYKYLLKTYDKDLLKKEAIHYFVNLVREYDTWEWVKTNNLDAKRLANLFDVYGREYFLKHYLEVLKTCDVFSFDEKELFLLETEERRIQTYIDEKKDSVIPVDVLNHKAGLVFASKYRSELGNALAREFETLYDFIIIVNIERGISYRGIKDVDLNEIAKVFGGKGHTNSSGSPLPNNITENVIDLIFNHKVKIDKDLVQKINS